MAHPFLRAFVYTKGKAHGGDQSAMKSITVQLDERLIEAAEARARSEQTTLDRQIEIWLADYAGESHRAQQAMAVVAALQSKLRTGGRKFTRDEMNER